MSNGIPVALACATEELRKYRRGLAAMSGGFTLSGGEPLMQDRFVVKLLAAAKQMEIHTALDTNGALGARLFDADLEQVDLVLLDLKSWGPRTSPQAYWHGGCASPGFCATISCSQNTDLGTVRARSWTYGRH
jgi:pyruvate formate lyase activating enzyme